MDTSDQPDRALEQAVLDLLGTRRPGTTICPSEAARAVGSESTWRALMPAARAAAGRLVQAGRVEVTQQGRSVDVATARGPVRIRLAQASGAVAPTARAGAGAHRDAAPGDGTSAATDTGGPATAGDTGERGDDAGDR